MAYETAPGISNVNLDNYDGYFTGAHDGFLNDTDLMFIIGNMNEIIKEADNPDTLEPGNKLYYAMNKLKCESIAVIEETSTDNYELLSKGKLPIGYTKTFVVVNIPNGKSVSIGDVKYNGSKLSDLGLTGDVSIVLKNLYVLTIDFSNGQYVAKALSSGYAVENGETVTTANILVDANSSYGGETTYAYVPGDVKTITSTTADKELVVTTKNTVVANVLLDNNATVSILISNGNTYAMGSAMHYTGNDASDDTYTLSFSSPIRSAVIKTIKRDASDNTVTVSVETKDALFPTGNESDFLLGDRFIKYLDSVVKDGVEDKKTREYIEYFPAGSNATPDNTKDWIIYTTPVTGKAIWEEAISSAGDIKFKLTKWDDDTSTTGWREYKELSSYDGVTKEDVINTLLGGSESNLQDDYNEVLNIKQTQLENVLDNYIIKGGDGRKIKVASPVNDDDAVNIKYLKDEFEVGSNDYNLADYVKGKIAGTNIHVSPKDFGRVIDANNTFYKNGNIYTEVKNYVGSVEEGKTDAGGKVRRVYSEDSMAISISNVAGKSVIDSIGNVIDMADMDNTAQSQAASICGAVIKPISIDNTLDEGFTIRDALAEKIYISSNGYNLYVLTTEGILYGVGGNANHEIDSTDASVTQFTEMATDVKAAKPVTGGIYYLTTDGNINGIGDGADLTIGSGNFVAFDADDNAIVAVDASCNIKVTGRAGANSSGRFGTNDKADKTDADAIVDNPQNMLLRPVQVLLLDEQCFIRLANGIVMVAGQNTNEIFNVSTDYLTEQLKFRPMYYDDYTQEGDGITTMAGYKDALFLSTNTGTLISCGNITPYFGTSYTKEVITTGVINAMCADRNILSYVGRDNTTYLIRNGKGIPEKTYTKTVYTAVANTVMGLSELGDIVKVGGEEPEVIIDIPFQPFSEDDGYLTEFFGKIDADQYKSVAIYGSKYIFLKYDGTIVNGTLPTTNKILEMVQGDGYLYTLEENPDGTKEAVSYATNGNREVLDVSKPTGIFYGHGTLAIRFLSVRNDTMFKIGGDNTSGKCGVGSTNDTVSLTEIDGIWYQNSKFASTAYSSVITTDSQVYVVGSNTHDYTAGVDTTGDNKFHAIPNVTLSYPEPTATTSAICIKSRIPNSSYYFAYAFGSGENEQLGLFHSVNTDTANDGLLHMDTRGRAFKDVVGNSAGFFMITSDGDIEITGYQEDICGIGSTYDFTIYIKSKIDFRRILYVSIDTLFIEDVNGRIYYMGLYDDKLYYIDERDAKILPVPIKITKKLGV